MRKLLLFSTLLFFAAACSDFSEEYSKTEGEKAESNGTDATNFEARDYYWSGGQKIWLDTDSTQMIVNFDNEEDFLAFSATIPEINLLAGKAMALVDVRDESIRQKVSVEKSVKNRIFAHKFSGTDVPFYLTGDIILKPKGNMSLGEILSKFQIKGEIVDKTSTGTVVIRLEEWSSILDTANSIYESELAEWCHPDFITPIERTTADLLFSQQYYLKNTQNTGIDINVEQAWTITQSSSDIRVAVIDDGVEEHEDLAGRVLQGYTPLNPTGYGRPTTQAVPNIGHGQACAGIIAASHNTLGIAGVAPNVKIVPINIFHTWYYDYNLYRWQSSESVQDIAKAIEYAWNPTKGNADVISNSWGFYTTPVQADYIKDEINNAVNMGRLRNGTRLGCVVVFASGNNHPHYGVGFPASHGAAIAVGAINRSGTVWNYSCRGDALDVVAPSGNINLLGDLAATDRMGANGYESGNYTLRFGGTSAAAPQVSGIAALVLSYRPQLTERQVRNAIESTCKKLSGYTPNVNRSNGTWHNDVGYGLVNAYRAVNAYIPPPPPTYYIGGNGSGYSSESTLYANGTGYAGTTLYAYPGGYRYVWSAEFYGECDRWYMWPNGHIADVSVYFNQGDEGGLIRFECAIYNGNTLLSTPTYYLTVLPDGQKSLKTDLPQSIADELEAIRAIRVTEESTI